MQRQSFTTPFMWLVNTAGVSVVLFSAYRLPTSKIDVRFLILAAITIVVSSRVAVRIPHVNNNVTVSDTFIFLTLLLYGGEAAVLLSAVEGVFAGLRISKKPRTVLFASAAIVCSTFFTAQTLAQVFGDPTAIIRQAFPVAAIAICLMALAQYAANTGLVAVGTALKNDQPIWITWRDHFLWLSITYFAGAAAAGLIASSFGTVGLYAVLIAVPFVSVVYLTYYRYLEEIKTSSRQAEHAERERAEQAERHVEELKHYVAELERISRALQESKEHFRHAAFHDSLTGLPNRNLLTENISFVMERSKRRENAQFAVLFLDLDRFKKVNESLGHTVGDELLITIARRLENCVRDVDTVARLGGDEFAILVDGVEDAREAEALAARVQEVLQKPFLLSGHEVYTSASIGIALGDDGYDEAENLLRDADTAMYHAKADGRARFKIFDKAMHARAVDLLRLETDLRRAVEREELILHYQPIVSLESGYISGFEALVRWQHPRRGLISPAEFIPVAEETGLIVPIGLWVLREACQQMCRWQWQSPANRSLSISVNLSGKQFAQTDLVADIERILRETNLPPHTLRLEITESVVMENAEAAARMLEELKALGVQLSIDDFGTGYSSLSYLQRFPIDTLKIDRSFIGRTCESEENREIVRTIVTLASNMGMQVVAEGIESLEQLNLLKSLKCESGQGYLFSKPVPAQAAAALLSRRPQWQAEPARLGTSSAGQAALIKFN